MYYLYHEFIQQIKQQQIQQYNQKHQHYLQKTNQPNHSTPAPPTKTNRRQRQFRPSSKPQPNKVEVPPTIQHQSQNHHFIQPEQQMIFPTRENIQHRHQPLQKIQLQRPIQQATHEQMIEEYAEIKLVPCPLNCGRSFKPQAIDKHAKVCKKVFQEKRKPFEVKTTPQQAEQVKNKSANNDNGKKNASWKKQSEKFRNMLKMGRGELSKEEIEEIDDRIQCPHCGRKFNETAATRHIQVCKKKANMKK